MKKRSLLLFCLCFCVGAACSLQHKKDVGADADAYGCKVSAGYIYSSVRGQCLRPWEEGIALSSVKLMSSRAYVILSADGTAAELFWAFGPSVLLKRAFNEQGPYWQKDQVRLERLPEGWRLYEEGRLLFRADNPPQE